MKSRFEDKRVTGNEKNPEGHSAIFTSRVTSTKYGKILGQFERETTRDGAAVEGFLLVVHCQGKHPLARDILLNTRLKDLTQHPPHRFHPIRSTVSGFQYYSKWQAPLLFVFFSRTDLLPAFRGPRSSGSLGAGHFF